MFPEASAKPQLPRGSVPARLLHSGTRFVEAGRRPEDGAIEIAAWSYALIAKLERVCRSPEVMSPEAWEKPR